MVLSVNEAANRALTEVQFRLLEPLYSAVRKRRRLAKFGFGDCSQLACAELNLAPDSSGCVEDCTELLARGQQEISKYLFREARSWFGSPVWRAVPCLIDLDLYPRYEDYRAQLKRHSKGGILQQIRKARASGFYARRIFRPLYYRQIAEVEASMLFRSGPVFAAFLRPLPRTEFSHGITLDQVAAYMGRPSSAVAQGIPFPEPPLPTCRHHWTMDWGVFLKERYQGREGLVFAERLVGYLYLKRMGNVVRTRGMMGHGAYRSHNVMKLLFDHVMQWLLARRDPHVIGVRYLHYGALEHGNDGLVSWKRSFEFRPYRFSCDNAGAARVR